jgi:hypothetical protein
MIGVDLPEMLMLLRAGVALTNLKSVKMIEAVAAILGLFSAGIFVAHAVDAYRAP